MYQSLVLFYGEVMKCFLFVHSIVLYYFLVLNYHLSSARSILYLILYCSCYYCDSCFKSLLYVCMFKSTFVLFLFFAKFATCFMFILSIVSYYFSFSTIFDPVLILNCLQYCIVVVTSVILAFSYSYLFVFLCFFLFWLFGFALAWVVRGAAFSFVSVVWRGVFYRSSRQSCLVVSLWVLVPFARGILLRLLYGSPRRKPGWRLTADCKLTNKVQFWINFDYRKAWDSIKLGN